MRRILTMINTQELIQKLDKLYGTGNGTRICMTILPGILGDFQKMLAASAPDSPVREEYRLEDGKGTLILTGMRKASGQTDVNAELTDF